MPWQKIPGIAGKLYVPELFEKGKKHPCEDCFTCQNCSQERCRVCREEKRGRRCSDAFKAQSPGLQTNQNS